MGTNVYQLVQRDFDLRKGSLLTFTEPVFQALSIPGNFFIFHKLIAAKGALIF